MTEKIVGLEKRRKKPRVTYRGFAKAFHRLSVERQHESVEPDETQLIPASNNSPMVWYTARLFGPGHQYREVASHALRDLGLKPELLVYRVLRDLYGQPDHITIALPAGYVEAPRELKEGEGPFFLEWGYLLAGQSETVYEIRRQPGTQEPHLAIWRPKLTSVASQKEALLDSEFKLFVRELRRTLEESQSLFDKRQAMKESMSIGLINIYFDLLAAGDDQIDVAEEVKSRGNISRESGSQSEQIISASRAAGTFYMAAAIQYLLAFEAFVNVISELLRKDEFADVIFNRMIGEADFESRLLSFSIFCRGFERAPFAPGSGLFKRLRDLRKFRNRILHGAVSHNDHVMRIAFEDQYMFNWWPAADERSGIADDSAQISLPLARVLFAKRHADLVRREVEAAVDAIIGAMQPDCRTWTNSWRSSSIIPAWMSADGWRPSFGGKVVAT